MMQHLLHQLQVDRKCTHDSLFQMIVSIAHLIMLPRGVDAHCLLVSRFCCLVQREVHDADSTNIDAGKGTNHGHCDPATRRILRCRLWPRIALLAWWTSRSLLTSRARISYVTWMAWWTIEALWTWWSVDAWWARRPRRSARGGSDSSSCLGLQQRRGTFSMILGEIGQIMNSISKWLFLLSRLF